MKISIVIPVYNEQDCIADCLNSVVSQTKSFDEIIVVNNNSNDSTLDIVNSFDNVIILNENKQGVAHAISTGYDKANGDIIARIDADTVLPSEWTINLLSIFKNKQISAVTGSAKYYDVNLSKFINKIDLYFRKSIASNLDMQFLWGANMALTKNAWLDIRNKLCKLPNIHEDYDLAIHLQENGHVVVFSESLNSNVSSRRIESNYIDFMKYVIKSPKSYSYHKQRAWRAMLPLIITLAVLYYPSKLLHLTYDTNKKGFNFNLLFNQKHNYSRVDPTTNIV